MLNKSKQEIAEIRKKKREAADGPSPKAEDGELFNPYQSKKAFQKASAKYAQSK